jgi:hydroxyacylglutathione hydrolase
VDIGRDVPAYIHPADRFALADPWTMHDQRPGGPIFGIPGLTFAEPDDVRELSDGEPLELAGMSFTVRHTPGHSRGSVVFGFSDADEPSLFAGDVLFAGSIGRTDLRGGSMAEMAASLRDVILPMDDDIVVYPGHGPRTTIGRERVTNPYLATEFLAASV